MFEDVANDEGHGRKMATLKLNHTWDLVLKPKGTKTNILQLVRNSNYGR